jgi:hypothetical protein
MDMPEQNRGAQQEKPPVRERQRKRGVLPCGVRVCVRCHKGCRVAMAAYLSGQDENEEIKEEDR